MRIVRYYLNKPLNQREAWGWLLEKTQNHSKIQVSIRLLAYKWRWHRSKVERFIKLLKDKGLINTEIKSGKTVIIIAETSAETGEEQFSKEIITVSDSRDSSRIDSKPPVINTEQVVFEHCNLDKETYLRNDSGYSEKARQFSTNITLEADGRDSASRYNSSTEVKAEQVIVEDHDADEGTSSRYNKAAFEKDKTLKKIKKEKKQKKKTKKTFKKKKILPMGVQKKKKLKKNLIDFEELTAESMSDFANSLAITADELSWELDKFKDHWRSLAKKPKDSEAAFRNWVRKAIELNGEHSYHC